MCTLLTALTPFVIIIMINFGMLSLNVRGLNSYAKRKSVFRWLEKSKNDLILLQETHTTLELETQFKNDWSGPMFFSHGTNNSRGCCILVRPTLDFKMISIKSDDSGRLLLVECLVNDVPVTIVNIYAPNEEQEHYQFLKALDELLDINNITNLNNIILGGDWNLIRNPELDRMGGNTPRKQRSRTLVETIMTKFDLRDVWRVKNPTSKRFTWRQKRPLIQCRLEFFLISESIFDNVDKIDIIPSIRSDHSAITINFTDITGDIKGPSHWKFNSSLLDDEEYIRQMKSKLDEWKIEHDLGNKQVAWELIKYEIRKFTIEYSKEKRREGNKTKKQLEQQLCYLEKTSRYR